jgi:hypothetical protein
MRLRRRMRGGAEGAAAEGRWDCGCGGWVEVDDGGGWEGGGGARAAAEGGSGAEAYS